MLIRVVTCLVTAIVVFTISSSKSVVLYADTMKTIPVIKMDRSGRKDVKESWRAYEVLNDGGASRRQRIKSRRGIPRADLRHPAHGFRNHLGIDCRRSGQHDCSAVVLCFSE